MFLGVSILSIVEIVYFMVFRQLSDETEREAEHETESHDPEIESPLPSLRQSISNISNATTIASIEIKADKSIVSNGY